MSHRHRSSRRLVMTALSTVLAAIPAAAQEPAPSPAPEPPGIEVSGLVDVYYGYNFNHADPLLRSFDGQHNTLTMSLAEIAFEKAVNMESRVGFRVDFDLGPTSDIVASFEPAENGREVYRLVQQAYLSLQASEKVTLDAGKFVTPIGAEVIESQDNWNYTRSILFGYAIPFYHVGVRAIFAVSDTVSLSGFVLNGWNNGSETNGGKTFALGATVTPSDRLTWVANVITGPEQQGTNDDWLTLFDTTVTFDVSPRFSLMGNLDYGTVRVAGEDVKWYGLAAYAKYQATRTWGLAGRYEWINDEEGGFMTIGQKAQSVTLTSDHLVADALKLRVEYRFDLTDNEYFPSDKGALKDSQSTLTVGVVYAFGGKI